MKIPSITKIFLIAFLVFFPSLLQADGTKVFTLKDGSMIKGQLAGFSQGMYEIQTANLGIIKLNEQDVVAIVQDGAASGAQAAHPSVLNIPGVSTQGVSPQMSQQMGAMQSQLMANPAMMQQVNQLGEDEELVKIVSDPKFMQELMNAAASGNAQNIVNDPKFQKILSNPTIQSIIRQMQETQKSQPPTP